MTYKFTYNVNSYYGRLLRVIDLLAGSSLVVRRDYRQHARYLTTMTTAGARPRLSQSQRQHRCHVTTDSNGLLASLTTSSSVVTRLSYVRDTGLLASRQTGSELYMYKYGQDGRLMSVIYGSGAQCVITNNNCCHAAGLQLSHIHYGTSPVPLLYSTSTITARPYMSLLSFHADMLRMSLVSERLNAYWIGLD